MKYLLLTLMLAVPLSGCDQSDDDSASGGGGAIDAVNHTHWAINHYSVNGQSGVDIIGPWQGGGGAGYFGVPAKWVPGMTVKVDWQTGEASTDDFPGYADRVKYLAWEKKIKASYKEHTATVPVPDYTGQLTCGIKIHFLPCDKIKVTTSCYDYGNPQYPIKDPIRMPEPETCPN